MQWARGFGVIHNRQSPRCQPGHTIQDLTDGFGADVVIVAVGLPQTCQQAFYARDVAGTVVLVGVPTGLTLEMPLIDFFSHGEALKFLWYADCMPKRDFSTLISLYRRPLGRFVTEHIGLGLPDAYPV